MKGPDYLKKGSEYLKVGVGSGAGLWHEFKAFALKGNVIDLAVAVIIGQAFGKVIDSLVKNLLMPLISYISVGGGGYRTWHVGRLEVGAFLSELINFFIIALALFLVMVKVLGTIKRATAPPPGEPATKECPFCLSTIPYRASRCSHCTSDQPSPAAPSAPVGGAHG